LGRREATLRSLEWIRDIRLAQHERSEHNAAQSMDALRGADSAVNDARVRANTALEAWVDATMKDGNFDHQIALFWAQEMRDGEGQLADAISIQVDQTDKLEAARADWQRALSLSERSSRDASHSRYKLHSWQEEQQLNDLSEVRPNRPTS
jgi:hypothetical protein